MPLKAFVATGIQSTPGDWEPLQKELDGIVDLIFADKQSEVSPLGIDADEWEQRTIEAERRIIREECCDLILAHSAGTLRVPRLMRETPQLKGGVLLTPARNTMKTSECALQRAEFKSLIEKMMWPVALDMSDDEFTKFITRHEAGYNKKIIAQKLKYLRDGKPFAQRFWEYQGPGKFLIFQGENDPWNPDEPLIHSNAINILLKDAYHYLHLSKTANVGQNIRNWIPTLEIQDSSVRRAANYVEIAV